LLVVAERVDSAVQVLAVLLVLVCKLITHHPKSTDALQEQHHGRQCHEAIGQRGPERGGHRARPRS
jgi:hypothetical protein